MFREILTERLVIRRLRADDADTMFAYRSHQEITRYQSWEPKSLQDVKSFITDMSSSALDSIGWHQIAITLRDGGKLIGDCGIHILANEPRIAEIGITIAPASQSNGYATEALSAVLELLFTTLGKHRVFASVDPCNLASMALMQRIGMRKEAHFILSLWFKDKWVDDVVFAMLATEWNQRNEQSHAQQVLNGQAEKS